MKYYRPHIDKKANKLTVASVERMNLPMSRLGSGGPEEAVAPSGENRWWPGRGQFQEGLGDSFNGPGGRVDERRGLRKTEEMGASHTGDWPFWERVHCSGSTLG